MDRVRGFHTRFMSLSKARILSVLTLLAVSALIVYSAFAAPDGSPSNQVATGGWLSPDPPMWTPHPTSTDTYPTEKRITSDISRQHLFLSRVRARNPEFEGIFGIDFGGDPDNPTGDPAYSRGGSVDLVIHAATDLVDVAPRGRYFIGESGAGESSDWRLSYEDMPLLVRTGEVNHGCIKPWNWFHSAIDRDVFLNVPMGHPLS